MFEIKLNSCELQVLKQKEMEKHFFCLQVPNILHPTLHDSPLEVSWGIVQSRCYPSIWTESSEPERKRQKSVSEATEDKKDQESDEEEEEEEEDEPSGATTRSTTRSEAQR